MLKTHLSAGVSDRKTTGFAFGRSLSGSWLSRDWGAFKSRLFCCDFYYHSSFVAWVSQPDPKKFAEICLVAFTVL